MGKASLNIAISGSYNGKAVERAEAAMHSMSVTAAATAGGMAGSLANAGSAAAEMGGKIYNAGEKMESVGGAATKYVSLPIAAAAVACGKAAVDIDTALTGVRKTVDGTEEQYQELKDAAIEFSKTNAVSASQILDIQALGAQLGFARDELQEFGEVTSGLDIATNMNAEQAGTEMAQFANITKMAHGQISNYASAIVGLGNTSATTESDISSMAMRIAAAGTQVGMSQADILGVSAALASMGVEAEAGGTAISTIMSNIDKSVAKGSDALKGWADRAGMSTEEFTSAMASNADQFKSLADSAGMTVKELSKEVLDNSDVLSTWASTAGMSADEFSAAWKDDPVQALASVFSGMEAATEAGGNMSLMLEDLGIDSIRQTDIMKRLAGNSELVTKSVATANDEWEKNTALQNEVDNRNESMAARFEILKNKVTAVAESVGTPLVNAALEFVDAAQPVIDAVSGAADAFADMDEQDQRMVVGIAAAVAAFGPVVTVLGKVTKGFGSLVVGVGKGMQGLSTFARGADGAASAASRLEAGAKAGAGATEGVGKAASAMAKATGASTAAASKYATSAMKQAEADVQAAMSARNRAMSQLLLAQNNEFVAKESGKASEAEMAALRNTTREAQRKVEAEKNAVKAALQKTDALKVSAEAESKLEAATKSSTSTTKASEAATKSSAAATRNAGKAASTAASGTGLLAKGMNLLSGACKATAIGLAVTLVADLAAQLVSYAEHQRLVEDATTGMIDAMGAIQEAYEGYTPSVDAATEALGGNAASADECLRAQADLAKSMKDTWAETGATAAQVDYYAGVIEELGGKGSLTAAEQAKLKDAVEQFNGIAGSAIEVTNAQTGELSEQAGSVRDLAAAYVEEAKAQAARELYAETTKQLLQDQLSLEEATRQLADAEEGFGIWLGDFPVLADESSVKYHEMQANVNDLQGAVDSATATQEQLLGVMSASAPAFSTLDAALGDSAAQMEGFGDVCSTELAGLESSFDGSLTSIVNACSTQGVAIPSSLASAITSSSSLPQGAQQMMLDAMVLQILNGDVEAAAKVLGHDIDDGLKAGIEGSAEMPKEAVGIMSQEVIDRAKSEWESHSPSQVMHRLGGDIDAGLSNGISENTSQPTTAIGTLAGLMQDAISGLPGFSHQTGTSSGSNLASSIGSFVGSVATSASSLFNSATRGISGAPNAFSSTGANAGSNLSRSIGSFSGSVASSAGSLFSSARRGISGTAGAFSSTGSNAASSYSRSIGNASAMSQGRSLANTAKSGMSSVSARGVGSNFASSFASGMGGVNVWGAAYRIGLNALGAIKSALGIASPSKEARKVGQFFGQGAVLGMRDEESAIEQQSRAMSEAMSIEPDVRATSKYVTRLDGERGGMHGGVTMNVTINVTCKDAREATQAGKSIANELYTEFARRERTFRR